MSDADRIAELEARTRGLEEEVAALGAIVTALLGTSRDDGELPLGEVALKIGLQGAFQRWPEVSQHDIRRLTAELIRSGLAPQSRPKTG